MGEPYNEKQQNFLRYKEQTLESQLEDTGSVKFIDAINDVITIIAPEPEEHMINLTLLRRRKESRYSDIQTSSLDGSDKAVDFFESKIPCLVAKNESILTEKRQEFS